MLEAMNFSMSATWVADKVGESSTSMFRSQVSGLSIVLGFLVLCGLLVGVVSDGEAGVMGGVGEAVWSLGSGLIGLIACGGLGLVEDEGSLSTEWSHGCEGAVGDMMSWNG